MRINDLDNKYVKYKDVYYKPTKCVSFDKCTGCAGLEFSLFTQCALRKCSKELYGLKDCAYNNFIFKKVTLLDVLKDL
jgi:hypothetical protein